MARSPYIDNVILTNKHSGKRTEKVQAFVIHHMAAKWTGKRCAEYFRDTPSRQASANYCIGYDGDVALNVEEENRAWTSSSNWADQRAITFELANSKMGEPWEVSDKTIRKAIIMLAEQHKRYGLKKATYTGDTKGTLWRHDWFAKTNCPGAYLGGKFAYIAEEINKILNEKPAVSSAKAHKVAKGDTLWGISKKYGVTVANLKAWNGLKSDLIVPNQVLNLQATASTPVAKPAAKKTYVTLAKHEPLWRAYRLGATPVAGNEVGFLAPSQYGGLEYQVLGYEDNGQCAIIQTEAFGKVKIFIKDPSAKIVTR